LQGSQPQIKLKNLKLFDFYPLRRESGVEGNFRLDSPATSERIRMACVDQFTEQVSHLSQCLRPYSHIFLIMTGKVMAKD